MDLKQARKESGLTQQELATKLGVGQPTVSSWEKGRTNPNPYYMQQIQNILGISKEEIFFNLFNYKMN
ncbi:MAG: helix-turn-helix transcriptional regulator [Aerococcus suis]|nr:helix-turn-helix transcriptional regulator [Aerococcus suis]